MNHRANNLSRREELPSVRVLLAHFKQKIFVDLRQRKEVRVVNVIDADLMHTVKNVAQVGFGIDADSLDGRHDPANDALFWRGGRIWQPRSRVDVQGVKRRQQLLIDEVKKL